MTDVTDALQKSATESWSSSRRGTWCDVTSVINRAGANSRLQYTPRGARTHPAGLLRRDVSKRESEWIGAGLLCTLPSTLRYASVLCHILLSSLCNCPKV